MAGKKNKRQAREFRVIGVTPGLINFKGRDWDLSIITEADAEVLIEAGCPYVEWVDDGVEGSPLVTE